MHMSTAWTFWLQDRYAQFGPNTRAKSSYSKVVLEILKREILEEKVLKHPN